MKLSLSLLSALVLGIVLSGCDQSGFDEVVVVPKGVPPRDSFSSEADYIVETIVLDIVEMLWFARFKDGNDLVFPLVEVIEDRLTDDRAPAFELKVRSATDGSVFANLSLEMTHSIWDPDLYANFARELIREMSWSELPEFSENVDRRDEIEWARGLADFQLNDLRAEDRRLSSELESSFLDGTLHVQSAVLNGLFGLTEHAGMFSDTRPALCRMTAHLVLAGALGTESSASKLVDLAHALRLTLCGNQTEALEMIERLDGIEGFTPWGKALRIRNNLDYGLVSLNEVSTHLEMTSRYLAHSSMVSSSIAWEAMDFEEFPPIDYLRIANSHPYTVGLGHILHEAAVPSELQWISTVVRGGSGDTLDVEDIVRLLNQAPQRCVEIGSSSETRVKVIGQGSWAASGQRHLCHALRRNAYFFSQLGWPEAKEEYSRKWREQFGGLWLYPFVDRSLSSDGRDVQLASDAAFERFEEMPQLITPLLVAVLWHTGDSTSREVSRQRPNDYEWFRHNPPPGTANLPQGRLSHDTICQQKGRIKILEELYQKAPYHPQISAALVYYKYGKEPSYEQLEEVYQPVMEYAPKVWVKLANTVLEDSSRYERLMIQAAQKQPSHYFTLGSYFADREKPEKALHAFENGVTFCQDEVAISNSVEWLVRYYLENERQEDAKRLAERAAATYSGGGLWALSVYLHAVGNYEESFEYVRKIEERYGLDRWLIEWCLFHEENTGDRSYLSHLEKNIRSIFPGGMQRVGIDDFRGAPQFGVEVLGENEMTKINGIYRGYVIVALNGRLVNDMRQYRYVRSMSDTSYMRYILWNGVSFFEKGMDLSSKFLGVDVESYVAGSDL